jgi:polysaccharide export outer membrane protein
VSPVTPAAIGGTNLPFQPIGASDLVRLTVYDSPELSQTFRVDKQGNLHLPLLDKPIPAAGMMPDTLRDNIAATLKARHLLVNPVVDVSVVEYRSREVTVAGAVKTPMTIQELGDLRLLDALGQAGGLLPEAGPESSSKPTAAHRRSRFGSSSTGSTRGSISPSLQVRGFACPSANRYLL